MKSKQIKDLTIHALLIAIMAVMAFTPLGYIKIGVVQMTLMCLPVTAGIFFGGKITGLILGAVFGATSLIQCFGLDPFGTTLFSMSPVKTIILCFVPRMLMGFLVGFFFELVYNPTKIHICLSSDIRKVSIAPTIIFSILSCGIYYIYWLYINMKNVKALRKDESGCFAEMLCVLFVPFYAPYWFYTRGEYIRIELKKNNIQALTNGIVTMALSLLGLGVIALSIIKNNYQVSVKSVATMVISLLGFNIVALSIMQNDFNLLETQSEKFIQKRTKNLSYPLASLLPPVFNTLFFVSTFILFFKGTDFYAGLEETFGTTNVFLFFAAFCGINAVLEAVLNTVVGIPVCKALEKIKKI